MFIGQASETFIPEGKRNQVPQDFIRSLFNPTIKKSSQSSAEGSSADALAPYPWLRASLEDYALATRLALEPTEARHAVCLMHDAIEFLLYEILLLTEHDIYNDGQHTIGFDGALTACEKKQIRIPLLGTVRTIQKQRGDAKHHAQRPDGNEFRRVVREFQILISQLVYEHFAESLAGGIRSLGLIPYHQSLYETYRKHRTHRWGLAMRAALGAILHKHRELVDLPEEYETVSSEEPYKIVAALERDVKSANYPAARKEILNIVQTLPETLKQFLDKKDERGAAEYAGKGYLQIDEILPSAFDIKSARKLTSKLMQPRDGIRGDHSWSKREPGDTKQTGELVSEIKNLLENNPKIVDFLGKPFLMEDDDSYWKWWELAVFDGEQWAVFHVSDRLDVSLESQSLDAEGVQRRERQAKAVYQEFSSLVDNPEVLNSPKVSGTIGI